MISSTSVLMATEPESQSQLQTDLAAQNITINNSDTFSAIVFQKINQSFTSILTKFHAGYFRISLSLTAQALLWKNLTEHAESQPQRSLLVVLWSFSLFALVFLSVLYLLRCVFFFKLVKAEFLHHVGVNYMFVPWISYLLLLQSVPLTTTTTTYSVLWWIFAAPVVVLDVKIYGQWFTKGKRFLSDVANPTSQLSVIGNLVGAYGAAEMGWRESAVALFGLGMVHYLVLFVTLYQRFSGGYRLPAMLRPVFFLFIAAPSVASLAWESIGGGRFDVGSKMLFFVSLFLFASLACRPILFKRSMRNFSIAWWAYSFPLTMLALASSNYSKQVNNPIAYALTFLLIALSVLVVVGLVLFTIFNTKMLLPDNDPISSSLLSQLPIVER